MKKNSVRICKQMVNKGDYRGFTLIELLAVIVILAIVAVITVPIILGVVEDAKREAFKDTAYGIIDAANLYYAQETLKGNNPSLTTFTVSNNKLVAGDKELSYTEKTPIGDSWVKINEKGSVSLRITDGKYYVSKDYDETGVVLAENEEEALTREELASELAELRSIVQSLQTDVNGNKTAIESNNNSLSSLQTELNQVKEKNNIIDNSLSTINGSVNNLNTQITENNFKGSTIAASVEPEITVTPNVGYTINYNGSSDNEIFNLANGKIKVKKAGWYSIQIYVRAFVYQPTWTAVYLLFNDAPQVIDTKMSSNSDYTTTLYNILPINLYLSPNTVLSAQFWANQSAKLYYSRMVLTYLHS